VSRETLGGPACSKIAELLAQILEGRPLNRTSKTTSNQGHFHFPTPNVQSYFTPEVKSYLHLKKLPPASSNVTIPPICSEFAYPKPARNMTGNSESWLGNVDQKETAKLSTPSGTGIQEIISSL